MLSILIAIADMIIAMAGLFIEIRREYPTPVAASTSCSRGFCPR